VFFFPTLSQKGLKVYEETGWKRKRKISIFVGGSLPRENMGIERGTFFLVRIKPPTHPRVKTGVEKRVFWILRGKKDSFQYLRFYYIICRGRGSGEKKDHYSRPSREGRGGELLPGRLQGEEFGEEQSYLSRQGEKKLLREERPKRV